MHALITGGSGFLGESLAGCLLDAGHKVMLVGRTASDVGDRPNCTFARADITDIAALQKIHKDSPDIDTVIHLAALVPKTKDDDLVQPMLKVNIEGTVNLLEVFGKKLRNFVYASSAEVYGLPADSGPIDETALPNPASYYGVSKLAGEHFCAVYAARNDLPIAMLRFTVLYGPGDRINRAIPNFIKKALAGENLEIYGGEELRDYLHVSDAVDALYLAATKAANGVFNIGTGEGISIQSAAQAIIQVINPNLSTHIASREKPASDIVLNIDKARRELNFQPKHIFPDLIEEQVEWHRHN